MKNNTQTLFLFLLLLVIPTAEVFACGDSTKKETTSCSMDDESNDEDMSCCDAEEKDQDDCNGACGDSSCHCPTTISLVSFLFNDSNFSNSNIFIFTENNWTYVQYIQKTVYLSLWQPPKIS